MISKDVLTQVDGRIAMKLIGKHNRGALGAWIEGQADKSDPLQSHGKDFPMHNPKDWELQTSIGGLPFKKLDEALH
jgi:hypothetical protein